LELEGKYERWTNFKTFVLLPAIKDINETSDVQVSWKPFTSGIRVGGIVFAYTLPKKGHTLLPKKVITQKKAPIAETIEAGVDPLKEWANMRKRFGDMPGVPAEIELQLKAKGWW
jgi:plasmid replication initiation protein